MAIYEILEPVWATIDSVTNRSEKHGEENKPAVSFGVSINTDREMVEQLGIGLADALFFLTQPGLPGVLPTSDVYALRAPCIEYLQIDKKLEGWTVRIAHGVEGAKTSRLVFGGCKIDKFRVTPGQRESKISFRIGTSDINAASLGEIGMLLLQKIELTITAPKVPKETKATKDKSAAAAVSTEPDLLGVPDEFTPVDALIGSDEMPSFDDVPDFEGVPSGEASKEALDAAGNPFGRTAEPLPEPDPDHAPKKRGRSKRTPGSAGVMQ